MHQAVIVSAVRTPIGSLNGSLCSLSATALGSIVIRECVRRANLAPDDVDEVIMGNVLSAGLGQAPARQASLGAGLPQRVGATTVNKVCGSGLKAVMFAVQAIRLEEGEVIVAGGMESMSNAPYLLDKARRGYRMGHETLIDGAVKDGLWDVYNDFHMGRAAELCADRFKITRAEQDSYAIQSYEQACAAAKRGDFKKESVIVRVPQEKGESLTAENDEELAKFDPEKLKRLRPAFRPDGSVTAGNGASWSDGASALLVMDEEKALRAGIRPLAKIVGYATFAAEPEWFTLAPVGAISTLLKKRGLRAEDVDLFEINEAFAVSSIAVNQELKLNPEKVNVRGGAVALGHPLGASGARILTTLVHAMAALGKRTGIAALCLGGGEAVAMLVKRDELCC